MKIKSNHSQSIVSPRDAPQALRRGDAGPRVEKLQRQLDARGAALDVDGQFGPKTQAAVRAFQKRSGLPATGQVDVATQAALDAPEAAPKDGFDPSAPMAHARRKLNIGRFGNTPGEGYENAFNGYFESGKTPAQTAKELLARHNRSQPEIVLNEVNVGLAGRGDARGAKYRAWLEQVVGKLAAAGKKVILCSAIRSNPNVDSLFRAIARIPGARLGLETQITGTDTPASVKWKLEHTTALMRGLGISPSRLVQVANLATSARGAGFGTNGGGQARFDRNIREEVRLALRLGYSAVMGYGFRETARSQNAFRRA